MWDMVHLAGLDHVHHIATDSLIVDGVGLGALQVAGLVEDGVLGLFRHEGTAEQCHIHGANVVDWGERKKRPGIKRGSREIAPNVWSVPKWSSFAEDTCKGNLDSVSIETWLVTLSLRYSRREVLSDGSTRPWSIENWTVTPEEQSRMSIGR
jgi:hypothetical protein